MSDDPFGNGQTLQQSHIQIMLDLATTPTSNTEEALMTVKDLLPLAVKADDPVARTKQMLDARHKKVAGLTAPLIVPTMSSTSLSGAAILQDQLRWQNHSQMQQQMISPQWTFGAQSGLSSNNI